MTAPEHPEALTPPTTPQRSRWKRIRGSFWFNLFAAVAVIALAQAFVVRLYQVPSSSMTQTLQIGDRILTDRLTMNWSDPATGDVVVFRAGDAWHPVAPLDDPLWRAAVRWLSDVTGIGPGSDHTLVKRTIGTPGDTVACCDDAGRLTVNGDPLDEPYVNNNPPFTPGTLDCETTPMSTRCFGPIEVPEHQYLMLGDNRGNSHDSVSPCRSRPADQCSPAFMERRDVIGRAIAILWPIGRWGGV